MSDHDKAYMQLFGTVDVTQEQKRYHYLVDLYRNNMLKEEQFNMLPASMAARKAELVKNMELQEVSILQDGAAVAEQLGLNRPGETGLARYLQDIKAVYKDIDQFPRFNMRMKALGAEVEAATAQKHKPVDINTFGPAIAAQGFYAGAQASGALGKFEFQLKQELQKSGLNLPKQQEEDYLEIATAAAGASLTLRKFIREGAQMNDADKYFVKVSKDYDHWAATNKLTAEQRQALNPVTLAQQGIEQARQAVRAARKNENGFSFGW